MSCGTIMLLATALAVAIPLAASADTADYVKTPDIEYGEREIEIKFGSAKLTDGAGREAAGTFGFGIGLTPYWFTEAYLKYEKSAGERRRFDAVEWENKFRFTETGRYPVDLGLFVELERPQLRSEGYEARFGPLLQAESGPVQFNANLFLKRQLRSEPEPGVANVTEMHYQMQAKYRLQREFEFGVQAFGELGKWNHWDNHRRQNHRIGPAVFGKLPLGGPQAFRYDAAWLVGASPAAPDATFRMQLEYEF